MMVLDRCELIQVRHPGLVVEFKESCRENLPTTAAIVCFPLQPKPHEYPAEWIYANWL
jgi:hypothetical protein